MRYILRSFFLWIFVILAFNDFDDFVTCVTSDPETMQDEDIMVLIRKKISNNQIRHYLEDAESKRMFLVNYKLYLIGFYVLCMRHRHKLSERYDIFFAIRS